MRAEGAGSGTQLSTDRVGHERGDGGSIVPRRVHRALELAQQAGTRQELHRVAQLRERRLHLSDGRVDDGAQGQRLLVAGALRKELVELSARRRRVVLPKFHPGQCEPGSPDRRARGLPLAASPRRRGRAPALPAATPAGSRPPAPGRQPRSLAARPRCRRRHRASGPRSGRAAPTPRRPWELPRPPPRRRSERRGSGPGEGGRHRGVDARPRASGPRRRRCPGLPRAARGARSGASDRRGQSIPSGPRGGSR